MTRLQLQTVRICAHRRLLSAEAEVERLQLELRAIREPFYALLLRVSELEQELELFRSDQGMRKQLKGMLDDENKRIRTHAEELIKDSHRKSLRRDPRDSRRSHFSVVQKGVRLQLR